jgi:5-(carboxyamino)imidazole ribonucleotide mutase
MKEMMTEKMTEEISIETKNQVALVMGSDSDWRVMSQAQKIFDEFEISVYRRVLSAHRTPQDLSVFVSAAEQSSIQIIIAGAGGAAHLPGMLAAYSILPVIGVPINTTSLQGLDALYSIVQMPQGIPVATMAIDQAANAALFAIQILATNQNNEQLKNRLKDYRKKLQDTSRQKNKIFSI